MSTASTGSRTEVTNTTTLTLNVPARESAMRILTPRGGPAEAPLGPAAALANRCATYCNGSGGFELLQERAVGRAQPLADRDARPPVELARRQLDVEAAAAQLAGAQGEQLGFDRVQSAGARGCAL